MVDIKANLDIFNTSWQCPVAGYYEARSPRILLLNNWRKLHLDILDLWRNEENLWIAKLDSQEGNNRGYPLFLFHIIFAFCEIALNLCLQLVSEKINFDFF